jgi:hypothetical protein
MAFDFEHYLRAFDGVDEAGFIRRFYTDDLLVESRAGIIRGHQEWLGNLSN